MTEHIAQRSAALAKQTLEEQIRAMEEAARGIFDKEVGATLRHLTASLTSVIERVNRPWHLLATHAVTALASCALTCVLLDHLFHR